jgi:hypothetical protein
MEDRTGGDLYLEMTDTDPSRYEAERVPWLLDLPGVSRVTWWSNARPDRGDLPRVLPEFGLLGIAECTEGFVAPADADDGVRRMHYRRYPRPAQGILSGRPTLGLLLVLISPHRRRDAQSLRDWADFVHIRHIAETANPGYTMITPYEDASRGDPLFMHLYEMDTADPETAFRAMTSRVSRQLGGGQGHPAFDRWATHDALRIYYVNTFSRLGEATA